MPDARQGCGPPCGDGVLLVVRVNLVCELVELSCALLQLLLQDALVDAVPVRVGRFLVRKLLFIPVRSPRGEVLLDLFLIIVCSLSRPD